MDIQAVATDSGLDILKKHVKERVRHYVLIGDDGADNAALELLVRSSSSSYEDVKAYCFHRELITLAKYDDDGIMVFDIPLQYDLDKAKYIYGIGLLGINDNGKELLVSVSPVPKMKKFKGIGGVYTYKINISGNAGEVIFNQSNGVTPQEMKDYVDDMLQRITSGLAVGELGDITYAADKGYRKNRLYCDGKPFIPALWPEFYDYWQKNGLEKVCGRDSFGYPRLPDLRGVVLRAVDDGAGQHGASKAFEYQYDANRNIKGGFASFDRANGFTTDGPMRIDWRWSASARSGGDDVWGTYISFDASRVVPVAPENRVKSRAAYPFITVDIKL